jgi:malate dehydrogenase
MEEVLKGV